MRAFYASCGVSESTTEAAIKLRLSVPIEEPKKLSPRNGKLKRKRQSTSPVDRSQVESPRAMTGARKRVCLFQ